MPHSWHQRRAYQAGIVDGAPTELDTVLFLTGIQEPAPYALELGSHFEDEVPGTLPTPLDISVLYARVERA